MVDPYATLGIDRSASQDDVERAYKRLARANHPDRGGDRDKFELVQKCYELLRDPELRARYNATGVFEECKADRSNSVLMGELGKCFAFVFNEMLKAGHNPAEQDLIARMTSAMTSALKGHEEHKVSAKKIIKQLREVYGRFSKKEDTIDINGIVQHYIEETERLVRGIDQQIEVCRKSLEFLSGFKFKSKRIRQQVFGAWQAANVTMTAGVSTAASSQI